MKVNEGHGEFHALDVGEGRRAPPGYPEGVEQKILAGRRRPAG